MTAAVCPLPHRAESDGTVRPRRAADGVRLCVGHLLGLHRDIAELPALDSDLLRAHVTSGDPGRDKVSGTPNPSMPIREEVAEARAGIMAFLAGWAGNVADERGTTAPRREVSALAVWLESQVDWIAAREFVVDVWAELIEAKAKAWRLAYPSGRRRIVVGECIEPDCAGTLIAYVASTDQLLPSTVVCDLRPEHEWPASRWKELARKVSGGLTATEIAVLYGTPFGTIYRLAAEQNWGRLRIEGVLYYRGSDVAAALAPEEESA